jgi:hypothetical protein
MAKLLPANQVPNNKKHCAKCPENCKKCDRKILDIDPVEVDGVEEWYVDRILNSRIIDQKLK